jgi:hypothetical protein
MAENGKDIRKITGAVEDAVTYPILTRDITAPPSYDAGVAGPGGGASLDSVALDTIRRLLGWRYRSDDTKGFLAALDKTFLLKEVRGHIEWDVKPQNYMVQADLGEITGAQASIYARAKVALDQSMPLLDGLTLLGAPQFDVEDMEATRALIRTELTGLVNELGVIGGPRIQRVDSLFSLLLGPNPDKAAADPAQVGGQLKQLADRFGLTSVNVNTIDDEQDYTNYLILVDYVNSLFQTWSNQKDFFTGKEEPFLGTQLVLLSQALDALVESVHEAYDAMDSVFFGASDRQATELKFFNEAPITIAQLFGWVEDFATNEGLQLVQEAGKDGVVAFRPTISRLEYLVFLALKDSLAHSSVPAHGFHTARVQRAIENVEDYLETTEERVEDIRRKDSEDPLTLKDVEPPTSTPPEKDPVPITVNGNNIQSGATMNLVSGDDPGAGISPINQADNRVNGGTQLTATFDLSGAPLGKYTVVVVNPDGQYAWLEDAFQIIQTSPPSASAPPMGGPPTAGGPPGSVGGPYNPGALRTWVVTPPAPTPAGPMTASSIVAAAANPTVSKVTPKTLKPGETRWVTIQGNNFAPGATIDFGAGIQVITAGFVSNTEYVVHIKVLPTAKSGPRDVTIKFGGLFSTRRDGFQVK